MLFDDELVIGWFLNDARGAARDFLSENGVTYPSGYDPDRTIARGWAPCGSL